ncbi:helix-turn-helix domain-containing protein [Mycoplasma leonicaptivi]|uniref:helix-turn-helix domain-containing protein n=1 Tax=Mycoplasma leonicaptivi TaxID=36742 RepID=UPI0004897AEF|nr:helix-turn-helix domain-containing protein [Mycoplasma leonicaptivi]
MNILGEKDFLQYDDLNNELKNLLRRKIEDNMVFQTFFKDFLIKDIKNNVIYFGSKNEIKQSDKTFIKNHFSDILNDIVNTLKNGHSWDFEETRIKKPLFSKKTNDNVIKKENTKNDVIKLQNVADFEIELKDNIKKEIVFDVILRSKYNKETYDICKMVSEGSSDIKLLIISGESGLGKTYFLHALGNSLIKNNKKGIYIDPSFFTRQISELIKQNDNNKILSFLNKIINLDFVIFDDFHVFGEGNKKQTKNFVKQIIDERINNNKLVVISSNLRTYEFEKIFDNTIYSRLQTGFNTIIKKPQDIDFINFLDFYLKQKEFDHKLLSKEAKSFVISYKNSITGLIGVSWKIAHYKNKFLENQDSLEVVQKILNEEIKKDRNITNDRILKTVSSYYKISLREILGKTRRKDIVIARHVCFYLLDDILNLSPTEIGRILNKDHSTVIVALKKIKDGTDNSSSIILAGNRIKKDL